MTQKATTTHTRRSMLGMASGLAVATISAATANSTAVAAVSASPLSRLFALWEEREAEHIRLIRVTDEHLVAGTVTDREWAEQHQACARADAVRTEIIAYRPKDASECSAKVRWLIDKTAEIPLEDGEVETLLRSLI